MRALLALTTLLVAAPAAAQSGLVIVAESAVEPVTLERARGAAIEVFAERGVRLVPTPDGAPCEEPACAATLAERAGATFAVVLAVEPREDGGQRVCATLALATGELLEETQPIEDGGVRPATAAALEAALDRRAADARGFLLVRSDPPGARVMIDGRDAGVAPLRRMASAGEHRVVVTVAGEEPVTRDVTVAAGEETALDFGGAAAEADTATPDPAGPARTEPSLWNWLIGGALALGGIITLLSPLQTLSQQGQCVDEIEGVGCVERVQFGPQSGVLMGVGLGAIIAAIVFDAVAPLRVEVTAGPDAAGVVVGGRF